jgi:hypothetical protein
MQLTIDTERDTLETAITAVYAAFGAPRPTYITQPDTDQINVAANGSSVLPGNWTDKRLRKWAQNITENAAEVVRYVAANAPEVSFDDTAEHLGRYLQMDGPVDGKVLGGAMSSGGHALKQVGQAVKAQPFDRDGGRRMYIIDPRIAEILADELGAPQA